MRLRGRVFGALRARAVRRARFGRAILAEFVCAILSTHQCTSRRYAEAFEEAGCLDHLEAFASTNGANFYGLPLNEGTVTLKREAWTAPATLPFGDEVVVPFRGGETVQWRLQR